VTSGSQTSVEAGSHGAAHGDRERGAAHFDRERGAAHGDRERAPDRSFLAELRDLTVAAGFRPEDVTVEARRDLRAVPDARLFVVDRGSPAGVLALLRDLEAHPAIASIRSTGRAGRVTVALRLTDQQVLALGRAVERDGAPHRPVDLPGAADPPRRLVGFLGANSSKSLHLGHLRNIVVGHATASLLTASGQPTAAYSLVGDIGRTVCEALAGHQLGLVPGDGDTWAKPDAYVGACYRAYLDEVAGDVASAPDEDDPCRREYEVVPDPADELMARWWAGDETTRTEWARLVGQVDAGHRATLASLDVTIDEWWPESRQVDDAVRLVDDAVARGIARRADDGRVVFDSTVPGFPTVVLSRSDGFPTEHARVVATFHRLFLAQAGPAIHLDFNGTEWEYAQAALTELMEALDLIPAPVAHVPAIHGMVVAGGAALSSGVDEPPLIDDLLAELVASPEIAVVCDGHDPGVAADLVLKTFFLSTPLAKPLVWSWDRLMDPQSNPGWAVARAWCRDDLAARAGTGQQPGEATDPHYRRAVIQSQTVPLEVAKCIEASGRVDLSHVTSLLVLSARRLLETDPGSGAARVGRATVRRGLDLLGLRTGEPPGGIP
jgi:hypothetical protein